MTVDVHLSHLLIYPKGLQTSGSFLDVKRALKIFLRHVVKIEERKIPELIPAGGNSTRIDMRLLLVIVQLLE